MHPPLPLTALDDDERGVALARFALLQPHLEHGVTLRALATQHGVAYRTLQVWLARYRQHGLAGLARQPRADRGTHRILPAELQQLITGLALQRPPLSAAAIHRQIAPVVAAQGWVLPSYRSVALLMQHLDPALVTLAQQGSRAYEEAFEMLYRREATRPNELWQADHCLLDIWLLDERGRPARPWLSIIEDDYSRMIAGFYLTFQAPTALQTALVLRQAIWRKAEPHWTICGIPERFYTDHGSDFTSQQMEQVSADLRMPLVFSQPGHPRGRGRIERFFQTLTQLWLCQQPGYTPAGSAKAIPSLTLAAFAPRLQAFLLDDYHQRIHGETHQAPQARWEAGAFIPRMPESLAQLDLLLLTLPKPRRVRRDGIHFQGFRYLDLTLAAYIGETVIIRYDPRDMAEIRVYHQGNFLCRAVAQEMDGQTISLKEIIRARNHQRHQLHTEVNAHRAIVEQLLPPLPIEPAPAPPAELPSDTTAPRVKRYTDD
ncbi:MAG: DDE-type integrase/transposase/recombinase [Chloroflexales bacterium]|nr:DDE-type integrase/transposase/recombinase [Chloroflexales bacterium]